MRQLFAEMRQDLSVIQILRVALFSNRERRWANRVFDRQARYRHPFAPVLRVRRASAKICGRDRRTPCAAPPILASVARVVISLRQAERPAP